MVSSILVSLFSLHFDALLSSFSVSLDRKMRQQSSSRREPINELPSLAFTADILTLQTRSEVLVSPDRQISG